ncbi:hypothetical protein NDU88_001183 [Pleurodeles waltl]|uniref:Uncharacterized protein n=1 Tax=Pleurodeles waltl TaxID=8319 RepID=A0AAV7WNI3_PLEWA|nr:hypothetical protein NDU88_001183 [Pleurodeles waltl]
MDMVSSRVGSRRVPETDRPEARWDWRARKCIQKPLQSGGSALAPARRITLQPDGTLAAEGDELYGQNTHGEQQRHPDSDTNALKDAPFEKAVWDGLTQYFNTNWGTSTTGACDWEVMKVVIMGLCMQTTDDVRCQLEKDILDHEAKLRDLKKCLPTQPQRMEEYPQARRLILIRCSESILKDFILAQGCSPGGWDGLPRQGPTSSTDAACQGPIRCSSRSGRNTSGHKTVKHIKNVWFYQKYADILSEKLLTVYQKVSARGSLLDSMREAWVAFIPKLDRDPMDQAAYRSLSLLNVDIKILSSILAICLLPQLTYHIREDQCGFIPHCSTMFSIRRLTHIFYTYLQWKEPVAFALLDIE